MGLSLAAVSLFWGLVTAWVFRRFTDRGAFRKVSNRLYAHLLEIRLFSDEPSLVWAAQKALILDNVRLLAVLARPVLIMALPFAFLYTQLDAIYGLAPLALGRSAVVTLQLSRELSAADAGYLLEAPPGIAIETPPVRDFADRQISWRIRPLSPVRGTLRFRPAGAGGEVMVADIAAGDQDLSFKRHREPAAVFFRPSEWVDVDYPKARVTIGGISLPWLAWFLAISSVAAVLSALLPAAKSQRPI